MREFYKEEIEKYRPITFWSWNSKLEESLLRQQIEEMKQSGMGGFFMHARSGLKTPYMGEEWFRAVEVSMEEAQKLNMQAWCYDENGWPSGFAGMKLLENEGNFAHYITFRENKFFDNTALAVYTLVDGRIKRVLSSDENTECYYTIYDCTNSSTVDILNPEIVRQFIQLTHEQYYERYGKDFGNKLIGFFTDEPQYFRYDTAYSPVLPTLYYELYQENMLDGLASLFLDCEDCYKFRYRYWKLMGDQFINSFAKQVYDWCEEHNCMLTGHAIEESFLFTQMWCCAGVMPFYEYEHIPGCDWLGRDIDTEITPKQVGSVAQQLGKKQALTESFAATGWDVTPRELKHLIDWQYVNGINTLCTHLTPYSLEGSRKYDHPTFFSKVNPWYEQFRIFSDYVARLGCLLAESKEYAPVGIIHPIHSAYLTFDRRNDSKSVEELETEFRELVERLGADNISHHYIDETILAKHGEVCGNTLRVGNCKYESIVIPNMLQLDRTTVEFLREFLENGGKLWLDGDVPRYMCGEPMDLSFLKSNITYDELKGDKYSIETDSKWIRSTYRISAEGDFIFIVNLNMRQDAEIVVNTKSSGMLLWDLVNGRCQRIAYDTEGDKISAKLLLKQGESIIVSLCEEPPADDKMAPAQKLLFTEPYMIYNDSNILVIDRVKISYDNVNYTDIMPLPAASDYLLSKCENRTVYLKYNFNIREIPQSLKLEMEKMNAGEMKLNGKDIALREGGILDSHFISGDIQPYVLQGDNELVVKINYYQQKHVYDVLYHTPDATESLINCLTYDTEIGCIYLRGRFGVYSEMPIRLQEDGTLLINSNVFIGQFCEARMEDIVGSGYPFFAGKMIFETSAKVEKVGELQIHLTGHYAAAEIIWNGYKTEAVLSEYITIPEQYVRVDNQIVLILYSGNRNFLGPHHWKKDSEPRAVSPNMFTFMDEWENETCERYRDSYSFVPFGARIESIEN